MIYTPESSGTNIKPYITAYIIRQKGVILISQSVNEPEEKQGQSASYSQRRRSLEQAARIGHMIG